MSSYRYFANLHSADKKGPPFIVDGRNAWYPLAEFMEWLAKNPPRKYVSKTQ